MAITEDASAPAVVHNTTTGTTAVTASFSPPANSLVVVMAMSGWGSAAAGASVACSSSPSVTWTAQATANGTASFYGQSGVFTHYYASAPGSMTVTATFDANNDRNGNALVVKVLLGADPSQTGASYSGSLTGTSFSAAITTTKTNSWVYGALNDSSNGDTLTALNGSTTIIDNDVNASNFCNVALKATSATGTPGSTTLGCSGPTGASHNLVMYEVLPLVISSGVRMINVNQAVNRASRW